jgi:hypothetical protein
MQSSSGPGRLSVAPDSDPGPAIAAARPPRRELAVEEWVAEPPASSLVKKATASRSTSSSTNALRSSAAAGVVAALHLGVGLWLLTSTGTRTHAPAAEPLVLLPASSLPPARLAPSDLAAELPHPDLVRITPIVPPMPHLPAPPAEIAVPVSASSDVLISEARAADVADLAASCRVPGTRPPSRAAAELTLLVHVEKDGRVSDSKVEVGSGVQRVDEAVQRCLGAHGLLTPRRINGAAVASWQRLHWPAV